MKDAFLGLTAGIIATACFVVSSQWLTYRAILIFPPSLGLFFGLLRRSPAEAWRAALTGILGIYVGTILFRLHGGVFLRSSISLVEAGVPVQLLSALTNPYAWALAFVAATPEGMKGSIKAGVLAAAICFLGVNLVTLIGPSVPQLNEMRLRGAWLTHHVATFFPFAINGLVLGIAVHVSEVMKGDAVAPGR